MINQKLHILETPEIYKNYTNPSLNNEIELNLFTLVKFNALRNILSQPSWNEI